MALGNPEMIQVHPTAIPGEDKCRLMSESARGEGGRLWVPRKKGDPRPPLDIPAAERWYFLEEKYPKYGNIVPRDIATREIFFICQDGYGVGGGRMVYLDVSHLPDETKKKLAGILEIYEKFVGEDPKKVPMKIFPAVHYTMGGLYTTFKAKSDQKGLVAGDPGNMVTNVPGLYAFGEVNYQYHGANRLGANALLNCIFDGIFCGLGVANYARNAKTPAADLPASVYEPVLVQEKAKAKKLIDSVSGSSGGTENPYTIHRRLGEEMTDAATVVRTDKGLKQAAEAVQTLRQQYQRVRLSDTGTWSNQNLSFTRALGDMIIYAQAILAGATARKESRGAHFRADYPERNDADFLRTTVVRYDTTTGMPRLEYEAVPTPLVTPRGRTYGKVDSAPTEKPQAAIAEAKA